MTPSKRVEDVVRAFKIVHDQDPESRLVIVGKGEDRYLQRLQGLAGTLGLSGSVEFAGGKPSYHERDAVMASLDCLVMASVREGWGLVVSEAARFGVPSVAYDVPGLRDSIDDGVSGKLVPNSDWRALGVATASIILDPDLRESTWRTSGAVTSPLFAAGVPGQRGQRSQGKWVLTCEILNFVDAIESPVAAAAASREIDSAKQRKYGIPSAK